MILWTDCSIPASIFFNIISKNDFSLLGKGTKQELESAFEKIFDEYYLLSDNKRLKSALDKECRIAILELKKINIKQCIYALMYIVSDIESKKSIALSLKKLGVSFNPDADVLEQCHKISKSNIGILENEINMLKSGVSKTKKRTLSTFESDLVAIENVLMRSIEENVSLAKFIELSKSAKAKSTANKKK